MTPLTTDLQLLLVMSVLSTVAHDLVPGMAVDTGHTFCMVNIIGKFKIKTVTGQTVGREFTLFVRRTIALCLKNTGIGNADAA